MENFNHMGFIGTKEYSEADHCWFGKIDNVKHDIVLYESETEEGLFDKFVEAANDYIDACNRIGKKIPFVE